MALKCKECGVSMFETPLHRTNPKGQSDAGWMCNPCIKKTEPELHTNLKADGEFKEADDIMGIINDWKEDDRNQQSLF